MPATITLTLESSERIRVYPARLHGALCKILEEPDADHRRQHKPFAAGPLRENEDGTRWRIGWLGKEQPARLPESVRFGDVTCAVRGVRLENLGYAELAQAKPARHAQFETLSPLYFSRDGRDHPLPDPVSIVRSLAQRWNAHAPAEFIIPDDVFRSLLDRVILHEMDGKTIRTPVSATMKQIGFFGTFRLGLTKTADHTTSTLFAALMQYATISGIGAQTSHGFGAMELTEIVP
ncbi:CRISPR system precrRNA processing endoribonuclease RAMP protein Cas6 [Saccharopolyspora sp. K220]|uniref:CRISPR system precrRNA processing endoribonuclease RAMP protein Cas6 n=1 Tax=Saccharopolyspora soli TaxID=2926618 RepID=UPI001F562F79|nr:CRISPR system precrRNA processing endoribonuclease RAMP protein Cas6 [Saccharopolyspora soli]MCI2423635.1 CRISPR system precrRNA processing endoribonuclease RAMP protein Cas6 [Saccharopolyspora soli]